MKYYVAFLTEGMVPVVSPFPPFPGARPGSLFSTPTRRPHEASPCADPVGYRQAWQHQVARSEVARSSSGDRGTSHDCGLVLDALVAIGAIQHANG
jgi:hypothetical protein